MHRLVSGAKRLGIELTPHQVAQFEVYSRELLAWNQRMNLTAITDPELIETRHFLDSLTVGPIVGERVEGRLAARVLDVGSGAGFPGIPLKIAYPELRVSLLEATQKKAAFLRYIAESLMLMDMAVITERAEDAAHLPRYRESYDVVTARAVAPMAVLAELTLPFCAVGGVVAAQKKGDITAELTQAEPAVRSLGGRLSGRQRVDLPELGEEREIVLMEKAAPTPARYPRKAGTPQRQPIAAERALRD